MTEKTNLSAKLGLDVFKENPDFHIKIHPDKKTDQRLLLAVKLCPAGLYSVQQNGCVELSQDGCLECGTCKLVCGSEVLAWKYPEGSAGVQFRFG